MIKFRPVRRSISASVKEERNFNSTEDMIRYLFRNWRRVLDYSGSAKPIRATDIVISDKESENPRTGWTNERMIFFRNECVGFCGEWCEE